MTISDHDLAQLERVLTLMRDFRVDVVQLGDVKVVKSQHEAPPQKPLTARELEERRAAKEREEEELLFYSSK